MKSNHQLTQICETSTTLTPRKLGRFPDHPGKTTWLAMADADFLVYLPSLKLTANAPENRVSQNNISLPTIHFQGRLLLVSGRLNVNEILGVS